MWSIDSACLGAGVSFLVDIQNMRDVHGGVALRRGQARLTEQLLDSPEVRSALQEVGGEAVAEGVRAYAAGQGQLQHPLTDDSPHISVRQAGPACVDEDRRI